MSLFVDRYQAGQALARKLSEYDIPDDAVVLGLARGGVPVAFEIARHLGIALDVFVARKLGVPAQPELAMGAIASGDVQVLDERLIGLLALSEARVDEVIARERLELQRRETAYRGERKPLKLAGKTVIIADDGLATGASMAVTLEAIKVQNPARIIVAVPVAPRQSVEAFEGRVSQMVCLATPEPFYAVGVWYEDFGETTDDEVRRLLSTFVRAAPAEGEGQEGGPATISLRDEEEQPVTIDTGSVVLEGTLCLPADARGVVLFAHGSGTSRFSPTHRQVAQRLHQSQLGTLLIDVLTADEELIDHRTRHLRFDIELLADRLVGAIDWLVTGARTQRLEIGLFGASTGAAAALVAAARRREAVRAVVSRGGRPDLAGAFLEKVHAPTLLLVGGFDEVVIALNEEAMTRLGARPRELRLISGATHLFSEPGALERVAEQAGSWFQRFLGQASHIEAR